MHAGTIVLVVAVCTAALVLYVLFACRLGRTGRRCDDDAAAEPPDHAEEGWPPGTRQSDYVCIANESLLSHMEATDPAAFRAGAVAYVRRYGCTYNQRRMVAAVMGGEPLYAPPDPRAVVPGPSDGPGGPNAPQKPRTRPDAPGGPPFGEPAVPPPPPPAVRQAWMVGWFGPGGG